MDSIATSQMQNHNGYTTLLDGELVSLCQESNESAFAELMARHRNSAMKIALSILRDRQEAEDEVQNAFWKAYEHIGNFQGDSKFSTWLTRIVVNQCLMRLRQLRRARILYLEEALSTKEESMTLELRDFRQSPEQELGREQVAKVLQDEIRRTPPLLRKVFLLRDVEQRPMPEVAEALGISVAAAKSRLLRARAELRLRLKKHCGNVGPATLIA
jgi:RNA polymerase sigma-70 factor (ECF subfamily)